MLTAAVSLPWPARCRGVPWWTPPALSACLAAFSVMAIGASALMIGAWPMFAVVLAAKLLHSAASCILGPAIAAISLGLVGHAAMAERLGRNARFASIGAGLAAAGMGTAGT